MEVICNPSICKKIKLYLYTLYLGCVSTYMHLCVIVEIKQHMVLSFYVLLSYWILCSFPSAITIYF